MKDFLDTGIIVGTSYIKDINYEDFDPKEIDANSETAYNRYAQKQKKVICANVLFELQELIRRRRILHDILLLELTGADEERINEEYLKIPLEGGGTSRDLGWIPSILNKLRKQKDIEKVNHLMEEIRNIFELNMQKIVNEFEIFRLNDSQKFVRDQIKDEINKLPKKPNISDIRILSNAIFYHNKRNEVEFVTVDKGFNLIDVPQMKINLKKFKVITKYPKIEVLCN